MRRTALGVAAASNPDAYPQASKQRRHHHLATHKNSSSKASPFRWKLLLFMASLTLMMALFALWTTYFVRSLSRMEHTSPMMMFTPDYSRGVRQQKSDGRTTISKEEEVPPPLSWLFDPVHVEEVQQHLLRTTGRTSPPLTAYAEPPLLSNNHNTTTTMLLPLRTHGPDDLVSYTYPQVNGCQNLQATWPTFHSDKLDSVYGSNMFHTRPFYPQRYEYAQDACPADADPFLPWIHDVFTSFDQQYYYMEFIAHNKRKCNTDPNIFQDDLHNLEPQVTIMQPVPIQRITHSEAQSLAPELWQHHDNNNVNHVDDSTSRYRLASQKEANVDARETRFICRFYTHTVVGKDDPLLRKIILGETLSVFPYNYEFANYKKPGSKPMLTSVTQGKDEQIWNSVLHFRCPIPVELQPFLATGETVMKDVASVYLELVPIRTRPRTTREGHIFQNKNTELDPTTEWGSRHVLPLVEASGRWSNIPVCRPPILDVVGTTTNDVTSAAAVEPDGGPAKDGQQRRDIGNHPQQGHTTSESTTSRTATKEPQRHYLIGCLWASASYTTRGGGVTDTSTSDRLLEWLTYHLYIAQFDHIYVYDNTGAHSSTNNNHTSLAGVTDLFPTSRVTRIPWPHRVCNNNRPNNANPGERSSQYAAEASCRVRYGPHADWMAVLDADEYLIPMGNWTDLQHWLKEGVDNQTHILSFFQTRARPVADLMEPYYADGPNNKCGQKKDAATCLAKRPETTFMETYDCESTPLPKPNYGWRAKKQIFRPWYVLNHYVHYSTVTKRLLDAPNEVSPRFVEKYPYERRVDELKEAFMLHTKTTSPEATLGWSEKCRRGDSCPVGIPWPTEKAQTEKEQVNNGMKFNCYRHERVTKDMVPRLESAMAPLLERYHSTAHERR